MSTWSQSAYLKALHFAAARHRGQKVPGTDHPYLVHVVSVCMELMAALVDESVSDPDLAIQCALLHDVVEDTPTTPEEVHAHFGPAITAGVDALSKRREAGDIKAARMADSLARIAEQPREVWMVKLADRITNLQAPPAHWSAEKARGYRAEARVILEALGSASVYLAQRLEERIANYEGYITAIE